MPRESSSAAAPAAVVAFLAGAVSASAVICAGGYVRSASLRRSGARRRPREDEARAREKFEDAGGRHPVEEGARGAVDGSEDTPESDPRKHPPLESRVSFSDRIGELPSKRASSRSRWPWDRIRRSLSSLGLGDGEDGDGERDGGDADRRKSAPAAVSSPLLDDDGGPIDTSAASDGIASPESDPSKGPCIGSIFGLDVGGSLAKLVYFEGQESKADELRMADMYRRRWRKEHYHQAASARAVLAARRGEDDDEDGGKSASENSGIRRPAWEGKSEPLIEEAMGQRQRETRRFMPSPQKKVRIRPSHSPQSEEDLKRLWDLRQASVPDDLSEFAEELHHDSTSESLPSSPERIQSAPAESDAATSATAPKLLTRSDSSSITKSRSMFDFSTHSAARAEALDRFYNFARRLNAYENNIKDEQLSFYSRRLGGDFHFIRFETRRMKNAMDLIRVNDLHKNIVEMGATGGGAHKYAEDWDKMLGIQMVRVEEMDSMVAGMQFVLADVVGECYTFRPRRSFIEAKSANVAERNDATGVASMERSVDITSPGENAATAAAEESSTVGNAASSSSHSTSSLGDESDLDYHIGHLRPDPKPQSQAPVPAPSPTQLPRAFSSTSSSSTASTKTRGSEGKTKVDEWWWSRKVQRDVASSSDLYPHLLVTIGTGVSILRVDGPRRHERISGSTIGGGTYWGLCRLLTDAESFDDVLNLAERGDPTKVDMMVGDIYGDNPDALEKLGLPSDIVASSFGKLVAKLNPAEGLRQEDLARALLLMVTNNIGQVAYLNSRLHSTNRIYFVGNFLRHNQISQRRLAYAINYWSGGETEALFLEHEGYFGALGAFLLSQGIPARGNLTKANAPATDDGAAEPGRRRAPSPLGVPPPLGVGQPGAHVTLTPLQRRSADGLSQHADMIGTGSTTDDERGGGDSGVSMVYRRRARALSN
mmetsp:Transcript_50696/g.152684  ORF Transcript_50696/g.152684 Transcript_50696/m.152684 type:complete len:939 (-) Transcript_50696:120-2936(-)